MRLPIDERQRLYSRRVHAAVQMAMSQGDARAATLLRTQEFDCVAVATVLEVIADDPDLIQRLGDALEARLSAQRRKAMS